MAASERVADLVLDGSSVGVVDEVVEHSGPGPCEWWECPVIDWSQSPRWPCADASVVMPALQASGAVGKCGEHVGRVAQIIQRPVTVQVLTGQAEPQRPG